MPTRTSDTAHGRVSITTDTLETAGTREFMARFGDINSALKQDSAELQRTVLLWQRWIRYAAAFLMAVGVGALLHRGAEREAWAPVALTASLYFCLNFLLAISLKRGEGKPIPPWLPPAVLLADVGMVTALVYWSTPPGEFYRVLLLGFLVLQLTVFYFGTVLGAAAAVLTVAAYVAGSLYLTPGIAGDQPAPAVVAFNSVVFLIIAGALIVTFGGFRARLNRLRRFCKRVEVGDLTGHYDADADRLPDDLTLLARSVDEMRHRLIGLIGTDPLTGCLNRRAFEMRLKREWRQAKRRDAPLAVLAVDLDNFKPINDTHGHAVGDIVLQELAQVMRNTARETDHIARVGGDEFVILLPDTPWQGAMTFAERLRRNVDEHRTFGGAQATVPVTISIGVALARGTDDVTPEYLLEEADRSLYRAKEGGRNRISA
jgi:diguanylate cyclase (GGDEF)-like protein